MYRPKGQISETMLAGALLAVAGGYLDVYTYLAADMFSPTPKPEIWFCLASIWLREIGEKRFPIWFPFWHLCWGSCSQLLSGSMRRREAVSLAPNYDSDRDCSTFGGWFHPCRRTGYSGKYDRFLCLFGPGAELS